MNSTERTATKEAFATVVAQVAQQFMDQGMNVFDAVDAATVHVARAAQRDDEVFVQTVAAFAA
jgi:uncharacterized protein (DUF302 family)